MIFLRMSEGITDKPQRARPTPEQIEKQTNENLVEAVARRQRKIEEAARLQREKEEAVRLEQQKQEEAVRLEKGKKTRELIRAAEQYQEKKTQPLPETPTSPSLPPIPEDIYPQNISPFPQPQSVAGEKFERIIAGQTAKPNKSRRTETRKEDIHTKPLVHESLRDQWHGHLDESAQIGWRQMTKGKK